MTVIVKKGETITCAEGHPICDLAEDVVSGTLIRVALFENWRDGKAHSGPEMPLCPTCGRFWMGFAHRMAKEYGVTPPRTGVLIHVGDEWR